MLPVPLAKLGVGVKTAVRELPVPLIAPSVPPDAFTSPALPSQVKLAPGSSEKLNVIVAMSPDFSDAELDVIATVGAVVSIK